jgi:SAM-dependent methyltransferase
MRWFGWFRKKPSRAGTTIETLALQEGTPLALVAGRMRTVGLPYTLPHDTEEVNRLDFQHYVLRYAFQGLYAAPIGNPASILDVGTGTGRWALEMAQLFPQARVVGLDVNPPPVDEAASSGAGVDLRPPNYAFIAGNLLEGLPVQDGTFDFVHMRLLFSAIPSERWPSVVAELARVTQLGGWVESVETTRVYNGGSNVDQMVEWLAQLSARRGVSVDNGGRVAEFMHGAGLSNVAASVVNLPMGASGGRLGELVATDYLAVCKGVGGFITAQGLATPDQFEATLAGMREDFTSPHLRCHGPFYIVIGQRAG